MNDQRPAITDAAEHLGRGAMGVVYKARHAKLNRIVALKMILAGGHAGIAELRRFRTESEAIAVLSHPNIVQIHEVGNHDGLPFLSLEYCGGGSLEKKLAGTPLPPREAAVLVERLACAMQVVHEKKVIHRDLKPANVLFADDGTPKITDFGLAKKLEDVGETRSGAIMGTPCYMAPEQARGESKEVGRACDIYALGATLYECLTGRPPFKAATVPDTLMQVVTDEPVAPSDFNTKMPRDLETICMKCLRKEPAQRYRTAGELADDLRRWQMGEPIKGRPVSQMERAGKLVRRNPVVTVLAAAVALTLVVGTVVAWVFALEADANADKANKKGIALTDALKIAEQAQREKIEELRGAYFAQAQAGRWSGQPGRRFSSLDAVTKAAAIKPSLELRNEAIACMALADIRVASQLELLPNERQAVAFDGTFSQYACSDGKGNIRIRETKYNQESLRLPGPGTHAWVLQFSPNGQFLAAVYHEHSEIKVWSLIRREAILTVKPSAGNFHFSPDSRHFAASQPNGDTSSLRVYDLASSAEVKRLTQVSKPGIHCVSSGRPESGHHRRASRQWTAVGSLCLRCDFGGM